jgi:hypothetical protein
MLKALGIVVLVVLILVGALMPLKYTARHGLPGKRTAAPRGRAGETRDEGGPRESQ